MLDAEPWGDRALAYAPLIEEYCHLALRPTLDPMAAQRLRDILHQAIGEPLLSLLLDQADTLLGYRAKPLDFATFQAQQTRLRRTLDRPWVEHRLTQGRPPGSPQPLE